MGLLLDTGVLIRAERRGKEGQDFSPLDFSPWVRYGDAAISAITASELLVGVHSSQRPFSLSILTITWSMCAAASFMLGLLHLLLWQQDRRAPVYLLSVLMAFSAGACALTELMLMHAASVEVYRRLLQWQNLFVFTLLMAVVWYVKARLPVARGWLAAAIAALWTVSILVNWLSPYSLVFSDITELRQMPTFWGEQFTLAVGPANPWVHVSNLASVLIVAYVIDAAVRTWRSGRPASGAAGGRQCRGLHRARRHPCTAGGRGHRGDALHGQLRLLGHRAGTELRAGLQCRAGVALRQGDRGQRAALARALDQRAPGRHRHRSAGAHHRRQPLPGAAHRIQHRRTDRKTASRADRGGGSGRAGRTPGRGGAVRPAPAQPLGSGLSLGRAARAGVVDGAPQPRRTGPMPACSASARTSPTGSPASASWNAPATSSSVWRVSMLPASWWPPSPTS
jgi:hypothetical protein